MLTYVDIRRIPWGVIGSIIRLRHNICYSDISLNLCHVFLNLALPYKCPPFTTNFLCIKNLYFVRNRVHNRTKSYYTLRRKCFSSGLPSDTRIPRAEMRLGCIPNEFDTFHYRNMLHFLCRKNKQ